MNRLTYLLVASGLSATLLAGCGQIEKRPSVKKRRAEEAEAARAQRAAEAAARRSSKPPPPAKAPQPARAPQSAKAPQPKPVITPGSIKYLDYKGGFRDAILSQKDSSFTNLVLKTQNDKLGIKTFTRPDEELSLGGIPLEGIEYSFFNGQLYKILIKWRIEQKEPGSGTPPMVTLAPFCAGLYGSPTRHAVKKDETQLQWRGQQVELTLSESVTHGVRDSLKGGWAIPPAASGLMVMEGIALRKAVTAMLASATEVRKDGL
jgi:hypothetical protein